MEKQDNVELIEMVEERLWELGWQSEEKWDIQLHIIFDILKYELKPEDYKEPSHD